MYWILQGICIKESELLNFGLLNNVDYVSVYTFLANQTTMCFDSNESEQTLNGTKYSRMDQVKFVEDSLSKIWMDMVCLSRLYPFKFFKGCLPKILLGPFLNTLSQMIPCLKINTKSMIKKRCSGSFNKKGFQLGQNYLKQCSFQKTVYIRSTINCLVWFETIKIKQNQIWIM